MVVETRKDADLAPTAQILLLCNFLQPLQLSEVWALFTPLWPLLLYLIKQIG
jgi:hypothetical protein